MKNWFMKNKTRIFVSTLLTLAPALIGCVIWNQLPETMVTHWGADGVADGYSSKAFAVFALPAIMAAANLLCMLASGLDPRQQEQNKKAANLIFWIMPIISFTSCGIFFAISLGKTMDIPMLLCLSMGVLFLIIGNYMPKVKQNSTLGIKISWTLVNEENWNRTHRFAGKLWVIGGVAILLMIFMPDKWVIPGVLITTLLMCIAPVLYSYRIYRIHLAQGIQYTVPPQEKKYRAVVSIFLVAVFAFVGVIMFTGNITCRIDEDSLYIEASYTADSVVSYDEIDSIELREAFSIGHRIMGYGSPRLSLGAFQNDEFQNYTLYSYNSCDSMILIRSGEKVLAFNAKTPEETRTLYETLLTKIG